MTSFRTVQSIPEDLFTKWVWHMHSKFKIPYVTYKYKYTMYFECLHFIEYFIFVFHSQNIVLSGGSTMFKDFNRRLQRDLKRTVEARLSMSEQLSQGRIKVSLNQKRYMVWGFIHPMPFFFSCTSPNLSK